MSVRGVSCGKGWLGRCAMAKGKKCRCRCKGKNHGKGRQRTLETYRTIGDVELTVEEAPPDNALEVTTVDGP